jgi:hypothetical protein
MAPYAVNVFFAGLQAHGDEPVWRKVLRHHLNHTNPNVAQQAAAALAENEDE